MISHIFLCVTSPQQFFLFVVVVVVVCEVCLIFYPSRTHSDRGKKEKKKKTLQGTNCPERLGESA